MLPVRHMVFSLLIVSGHGAPNADSKIMKMVERNVSMTIETVNLTLDPEEDLLSHAFSLHEILLEEMMCQTDEDCKVKLPNLEVALGKASNIPSAPFCVNTSSVQFSGHCSCGAGKCVSSTKEFGRGTILYYCGPCYIVGAACSETSPCHHKAAKCRNSYCGCKNGGDFYEFIYCEVPHLGYALAVQMSIFVCTVGIICLMMSAAYTVIKAHPRRGLAQFIEELQQVNIYTSPSDDHPPNYDELEDNPPSYDDALGAMCKENNSDFGHLNLALEQTEGEVSCDAPIREAQAPSSSHTQRQSRCSHSNFPCRHDICLHHSTGVEMLARPLSHQPIERPIRNELQTQHNKS